MVSWVEINLKAISENLRVIRDSMSDKTHIMAIVKSNAYGHGITEVAKFLQKEGVGWFGVTTFNEALMLKDAGINAKILILTYVEPKNIGPAIEHEFRLTLYDPTQLAIIEKQAKLKNKPSFVHLKLETGLHRLGMTTAQAQAVLAKISQYIVFEGTFTHFASSDTDAAYTRDQLKLFLSFTSTLKPTILKHAANSAAIFNPPAGGQAARLDIARPGIALYGYLATSMHPQLVPVLTWKAKIISIKRVAKGSRVGYGGIHTTSRDSVVAVVAVGYADGYSRNLSNKSSMLVEGVRCPVLGRIAMSMTMVDVTRVPQKNFAVGTEVIIIGQSGKETITALDLAQILDTNTHEILTRIPATIPRVYS